jgi:hypothetical protein
MKLIRRILILIIVAALGTIIHLRYKAVDNIVSQSQEEMKPDGLSSRTGGGIGPVGNPYSDNLSGKSVRKKAF